MVITLKKRKVEINEWELKVMGLQARGYTAPEISKKLGVNGRTLENKIFKLCKRIKVKNTKELIYLLTKKEII
jgi:DNA-binding NarL/FixJ family response regulator